MLDWILSDWFNGVAFELTRAWLELWIRVWVWLDGRFNVQLLLLMMMMPGRGRKKINVIRRSQKLTFEKSDHSHSHTIILTLKGEIITSKMWIGFRVTNSFLMVLYCILRDFFLLCCCAFYLTLNEGNQWFFDNYPKGNKKTYESVASRSESIKYVYFYAS